MDQALTTTVRRRGHQHHPRHTTRRRLDISSRGPAQCGPTGSNADSQQYQHCHSGEFTYDGCTSATTITTTTITPTIITSTNDNDKLNDNNKYDKILDNILTDDKQNHQHDKLIVLTEFDDNSDETIQHRPAQCGQSRLDIKLSFDDNDNRNNHDDDDDDDDDNDYDNIKYSDDEDSNKNKSKKRQEKIKIKESPKTTPIRTRKKNIPEPEHAVARARGDGHSDDENYIIEEDPEILELAKLRCTSERAEVQSEREARRRKRCADYPGLAFGSSIFSSDTMMKFSLIKNELSNIMGNQLKRVSILAGI